MHSIQVDEVTQTFLSLLVLLPACLWPSTGLCPQKVKQLLQASKAQPLTGVGALHGSPPDRLSLLICHRRNMYAR
jgi:hypothetical protein